MQHLDFPSRFSIPPVAYEGRDWMGRVTLELTARSMPLDMCDFTAYILISTYVAGAGQAPRVHTHKRICQLAGSG